MGFSISWVAFSALDRIEALRRAGFRDSEPATETHDMGTLGAPFSLAEIPTGWTVLLSNDFRYASAERLAALSAGAVVIGLQAEEHVMFSGARCYTDSRESWSVCHDRQRGPYDLATSGNPPAALETIKARLSVKQSAGDGVMLGSASGTKAGKYLIELLKGCNMNLADNPGERWMAVDYMFDVPVELAAELTGFRHDRWKFEWGRPQFTKLERVD
jgi:hypothetical protein